MFELMTVDEPVSASWLADTTASRHIAFTAHIVKYHHYAVTFLIGPESARPTC